MVLHSVLNGGAAGRCCQTWIFDLDTPIQAYGGRPNANWSRTGTKLFPNLTARHLIPQTSGVGLFSPGQNLTYDSDAHIQHLSYLLNHTTRSNTTAHQWATDIFATLPGIPDYDKYAYGDPLNIGTEESVPEVTSPLIAPSLPGSASCLSTKGNASSSRPTVA